MGSTLRGLIPRLPMSRRKPHPRFKLMDSPAWKRLLERGPPSFPFSACWLCGKKNNLGRCSKCQQVQIFMGNVLSADKLTQAVYCKDGDCNLLDSPNHSPSCSMSNHAELKNTLRLNCGRAHRTARHEPVSCFPRMPWTIHAWGSR